MWSPRYNLYSSRTTCILLVVCGLYFLIFITECDENYFGRNCENMCNVTCKGCNVTNGICDKGCQPGWSGLFCQDGIFCEMHFNFFLMANQYFFFSVYNIPYYWLIIICHSSRFKHIFLFLI